MPKQMEARVSLGTGIVFESLPDWHDPMAPSAARSSRCSATRSAGRPPAAADKGPATINYWPGSVDRCSHRGLERARAASSRRSRPRRARARSTRPTRHRLCRAISRRIFLMPFPPDNDARCRVREKDLPSRADGGGRVRRRRAPRQHRHVRLRRASCRSACASGRFSRPRRRSTSSRRCPPSSTASATGASSRRVRTPTSCCSTRPRWGRNPSGCSATCPVMHRASSPPDPASSRCSSTASRSSPVASSPTPARARSCVPDATP